MDIDDFVKDFTPPERHGLSIEDFFAFHMDGEPAFTFGEYWKRFLIYRVEKEVEQVFG